MRTQVDYAMRLEISGRIQQYINTYHDGNVKEFGMHADLTTSQLTKYLTGEVMPGISVMERLYRAGMNLNWLVSGKGSLQHNT